MKKLLLAAAILVLFYLSQGEEFNGTTYKLSLSDIEVARPFNGSNINLTLHDRAENISLISADGNRTGVNSTYSFWAGEYIYRIHFDHNVKGELVYTIPHRGQQFILPLHDNSSVRVVLPPGYTTGDRILGIASPSPDEIKTDENGTVLTWNSPQSQAIDVGYYKVNAPVALKRIFALLAAIAALLLIEYSIRIRKLRAMSKDVEKKLGPFNKP
jgi:hypothetical protein